MANGIKKNFTIQINTSTLEAAKDIVYWTPGLSLSGLVETLLQEFVNQNETINGKCEPRTGNIKVGRRAK